MVNKSIYFLHIPKTSGTSTIVYLDKFFEKDDIFPYQRWDMAFLEKSPIELTQILNQNQYKFYRGHFGYHKKFINNKFIFTMLRNPANHTISQYNHIVKYPNGNGWVRNFLKHDKESLKSILSDPNRASIITNVQTRYLSSTYNPKHETKIDYLYLYDQNSSFVKNTITNPKKSLIIAVIRLLNMDFFGLQEYHEESMLMLSEKLQVKSKLLTKKHQTSSAEAFANETNTETQNLLFHINNLDNKLYFIGRYIFEKRLMNFVNHKLKTELNIYQYLSDRKRYINEMQNL